MSDVDPERTDKYKKSASYEEMLDDFNRRIAEMDPPTREKPEHPVIFILGVPRSGTTLLYQVLAAGGAFGYCSNLMARFHRAPWTGARIERILEPVLERRPFSFESNAGLTEHWYEPHEFGYFWERHFPFEEHHQPETPGALDLSALREELGAMEYELARPLLFKNVLLDFVAPAIAEQIESARFVHIRRDPMLVAQSLYRTRIDYYGTPDAWFSVRPRQFDDVLDEPVAQQIAFQIEEVREALDDAEDEIDDERWINLTYADLCDAPRQTTRQIYELAGLEPEGAESAHIPETFPCSDTLTLDDDVLAQLESALSL